MVQNVFMHPQTKKFLEGDWAPTFGPLKKVKIKNLGISVENIAALKYYLDYSKYGNEMRHAMTMKLSEITQAIANGALPTENVGKKVTQPTPQPSAKSIELKELTTQLEWVNQKRRELKSKIRKLKK